METCTECREMFNYRRRFEGVRRHSHKDNQYTCDWCRTGKKVCGSWSRDHEGNIAEPFRCDDCLETD